MQCDDKVRQDDVVTSKEELAQTLQRFTLTEGGSTDFRPAFRYVDQLMQSGRSAICKGFCTLRTAREYIRQNDRNIRQRLSLRRIMRKRQCHRGRCGSALIIEEIMEGK